VKTPPATKIWTLWNAALVRDSELRRSCLADVAGSRTASSAARFLRQTRASADRTSLVEQALEHAHGVVPQRTGLPLVPFPPQQSRPGELASLRTSGATTSSGRHRRSRTRHGSTGTEGLDGDQVSSTDLGRANCRDVRSPMVMGGPHETAQRHCGIATGLGHFPLGPEPVSLTLADAFRHNRSGSESRPRGPFERPKDALGTHLAPCRCAGAS
jgi:hypothetical protein